MIRLPEFCPRGPPSVYSLTYLRNPFLSLSLFSQRPASEDTSSRSTEHDLVLMTQCDQCFCLFPHCQSFLAMMIDYGSAVQSKSQAERVKLPLGQGEGVPYS